MFKWLFVNYRRVCARYLRYYFFSAGVVHIKGAEHFNLIIYATFRAFSLLLRLLLLYINWVGYLFIYICRAV